MAVLLVVSDANVLIDMETGGLTGSLFSLGHDIVVADVVFAEELADQHGHLLTMGLSQKILEPAAIGRMASLVATYAAVSRNDLFSLALAQQEACCLLTGDADLRKAAEREGIPVHGTLWAVEEMVRAGLITKAVARAAYGRMRDSGRRLPWDLAHERLDGLIGLSGL
jgi:predicted nucleic acid-binding protein